MNNLIINALYCVDMYLGNGNRLIAPQLIILCLLQVAVPPFDPASASIGPAITEGTALQLGPVFIEARIAFRL